MAFKKKSFVAIESKGFTPTVEQVFNKDLVASGKNVKIVAGAGSGKSSSLRYTAASIPEKNFLVLCFNKANAKESNEHPDRPDNIFYSTIHSLAYKEIVDSSYRKKLKYLSWNDLDSKSIEDIVSLYPLNAEDSKKISSLLTKECLNSVNLFCRSAGTDILDFVSNYLHYTFTTTDKHMAEFVLTDDDIIDLSTIVYNYWLYITNKKSEGTISHDVYLKLYDLEGFIIEQVWDDRVKGYVSIDIVCLDEAQDTNPASESIFAKQEMQKVLVGDPMQCLIAGTIVGDKLIENVKVGDLVPSAIKGNIEYQKVTSIVSKDITDTVVIIKTASGKELVSTKFHTHFALLPDTSDIYYIYLMYKKGKGYRIGLTTNITQRCKGETGDAIWMLKCFGTDLVAARTYETITSYNYKIPETIFKITKREGELPQNALDTIWANIDSTTGALALLKELHLDVNMPHYQPVAYLTQQMNVTITLIGDSVTNIRHRYSVILPKDDAIIFKAKFPSYNVRTTSKADNSCRVEGVSRDLSVCYKVWEDIKETFPNARLRELARVAKDSSLDFFPATNIIEGMSVLSEIDGVLQLDKVVEVIKELRSCTVYDLNIQDTHNFIANGIVTHNCLYAWRGGMDIMSLPYYDSFSTGYLTESFRFNSDIADKANKILRLSGSSMQVKGSSIKTDITTYAHLCRTNASVLEAIFSYIGSGKKVYTSIDLSDTFNKLYHIQSCFFGQVPKYPNKELSAITDRESLEKALEFSDELGRLQTISKSLTAKGDNLYNVKKTLDSIIVKVPSDADIVITTIHASKGMEYDHVVIDDDILPRAKDGEIQEALDTFWDTESLRCLLYVGITRSRVTVILPWYFEGVFNKGSYNVKELPILESNMIILEKVKSNVAGRRE